MVLLVVYEYANPVYEPRLAVEAILKISGDKYTGLTKDKKLELMLDNVNNENKYTLW